MHIKCYVLQISLGKSLKALVVLGGLIIEWVVVKGINEELLSENGKLDFWKKSKYLVFQKVSKKPALQRN